MIVVDPRSGSKDLIPYFRPYGDVDVVEMLLEFGDIKFMGESEGLSVTVGIEHKQIQDLVQSMRDNRLSGHQLPGMCVEYDYVFFCIQNPYRAGSGGELVVLAGRDWVPMRIGTRHVLYREVSNYLTTLQLKCGVDVVRTSNAEESVAWIVGLYHWFQKTVHDAHLNVIYRPDMPQEKQQHRRRGFIQDMKQPGPVEIVANCLPGIDRRAWGLARSFRDVRHLVNADVKELSAAEGVGKAGAKKIEEWVTRLNPNYNSNKQ